MIITININVITFRQSRTHLIEELVSKVQYLGKKKRG